MLEIKSVVVNSKSGPGIIVFDPESDYGHGIGISIAKMLVEHLSKGNNFSVVARLLLMNDFNEEHLDSIIRYAKASKVSRIRGRLNQD